MVDSDRLAAFCQPRMLSILRIMTGLLYIESGTAKLFGFPQPGPHLTPLLWVAAILETFGGALLVAGLFTRPVAFLLSGEMAVAYFMVFAPHSFYPLVNRGWPVVLLCFVFFYFFVAGPGVWSLDALRSRGRVAGRATA